MSRDLDQFFEEVVLPDCRGPFYVLAHSTGSLVALLAAPAMVNRVRRMVLVAPLLALHRLALLDDRRSAGWPRALYWIGLGSMLRRPAAAAARDRRRSPPTC